MTQNKEVGVSNGSTLLANECLSKQQVSQEYILHSAINEHSQAKVAISLSSYEILLYDIESQAKVVCFKSHKNTVTDIKFSQQSPDLLLSSSLDGSILVWDFRSGIQPVQTYFDDSDEVRKPITCFDYDLSEEHICGGTEVIREDSFLLFWDKRKSNALGGYWNSHYDEITQVQFHSSEDSHMASSSVDGIVNIFDLYEQSEDDALSNTLNVDSAVNKFCWGSSDSMSCITSTEEYQFWITSEAKPAVCMSRKQLSEDFMCNVDYLIDTFEVNNSMYLAAGSNDGALQIYSCKRKGLEIIRELTTGHTDAIRAVSHSKKNKYFISGSEDGVLCTWKSPL